MKKMLIGAAVAAAVATALRLLGPALGRRLMKQCEGMFAGMPEDCPPKRMLRSLEEIREQNTQILQRLEQAEQRRADASA